MKFDAEDPKVVTEGEKVDRSQGAARAISVSSAAHGPLINC